MLCNSIPNRLSLTFAKISEAKWSDNDRQSVIERCGTQLRASASQVFIDLICTLLSTKTPRSLSPVSNPLCNAHVSAWRVLRHTRLIVVELKDKGMTLYLLQLLSLIPARSPKK